MPLYKQVSAQIHQIFQRYTSIIEPLSLDEAYLDVTDCTQCSGSATWIAQEIRQAIFDELKLESLTKEMKGYLPIYLSTPKGTKIVIMESDLSDYPNLFLTGNRNNTLSGEFPPVVLKVH